MDHIQLIEENGKSQEGAGLLETEREKGSESKVLEEDSIVKSLMSKETESCNQTLGSGSAIQEATSVRCSLVHMMDVETNTLPEESSRVQLRELD